MNRFLSLFQFGSGRALAGAVILTHVASVFAIQSYAPRSIALAVFIYFLTGCLGSSVVLHRFLSHRSWACPRWLEIAGSFFVTIGLIGSTITWTSIHRAHHAHTDTPKDPHSPHHMHWFKVHFFTMTYRPRLRLAEDLIRDPVHRFFHRYYWLVNFCFASLLWTIGGVSMLAWGYAVPAVFLWHAGGGINSIGHLWGTRPSTLRNESRNNWLLAVLMWGEGWHNNHHRFPNSPYFGIRWYEIDIGGWFVRFFRESEVQLPVESHK